HRRRPHVYELLYHAPPSLGAFRGPTWHGAEHVRADVCPPRTPRPQSPPPLPPCPVFYPRFTPFHTLLPQICLES
ncbi:hypothetical protein BE221DRAFT_63597, partial [Ostreococcus tauri]